MVRFGWQPSKANAHGWQMVGYQLGASPTVVTLEVHSCVFSLQKCYKMKLFKRRNLFHVLRVIGEGWHKSQPIIESSLSVHIWIILMLLCIHCYVMQKLLQTHAQLMVHSSKMHQEWYLILPGYQHPGIHELLVYYGWLLFLLNFREKHNTSILIAALFQTKWLGSFVAPPAIHNYIQSAYTRVTYTVSQVY